MSKNYRKKKKDEEMQNKEKSFTVHKKESSLFSCLR